MTTYDTIIKNRLKGIPVVISKSPIKNNVLSSYSYESNSLISFNKNDDYAMFYGINDCIYWIQNNFTKSGKNYILYTLRSDGTLLMHPTNKMLNYSDQSTFLGHPFGIVCNIYQSSTPKIPIDDLNDGCCFGLLFNSEYKLLTGSNPGHASGLSDPINKETFQKLTGRGSPDSFGAATFPNKGSTRYPLYSDNIDVTIGISNDPYDYYKTRCNYAIEASRGKDGKGYSPLVGSMYSNTTINMELSYPYGYISYEEYKKNDQIIKGYDIRYKITYYTNDNNTSEYKITSDGLLYINDSQYNLSPSILYIPLDAQGLLWYSEYYNMLKLSSYDKIYEELTGVKRGGLNDPGNNLPKINPNEPIDTTPINTQPPDNTTPSDPGAPIDVDDNDNTYNNDDPEVGSPQQPPPSNTTEQNTNDTSGDIEQNTVANLTSVLYQNATDPGTGNSTDTQSLINETLSFLGNSITFLDGTKNETDIAVVEFNKGKDEVVVFEYSDIIKSIRRKFKNMDDYIQIVNGKPKFTERAIKIFLENFTENSEGDHVFWQIATIIRNTAPVEFKSIEDREKYVYDTLEILMGEENLKKFSVLNALIRPTLLSQQIDAYNKELDNPIREEISTKEKLINSLQKKIDNAPNNNERLKLKQVQFLVEQDKYTERQMNDMLLAKKDGFTLSGLAIVHLGIIVTLVFVAYGYVGTKKIKENIRKKNMETGEKLKIYD